MSEQLMINEREVDPLHLGGRLGTLEQEVSGLKTDINYIRQQIGELAHSFGQFINSTKTNWNVLAAWSIVILTLMVFYNKLTTVPYDNFIVLSHERYNQTQELFENNTQDKKELFQYVIENKIKTEYLEKCLGKIEEDVNQKAIWTKEDHREYSALIEKQIENLIKSNGSP